MSVSHFVDEMTRDRYSLAGRLGTSNCELLFSSCFVGHCFPFVVVVVYQIAAVFPVLGKFEKLAVAN